MDFNEITFGGSNLDRAAQIRTDEAALAAGLKDRKSRTILLWRGKLLASGEDMKTLARLPLDHAALQGDKKGPIFLGLDEGIHCFAHDISSWEPAEQELPEDSFVDQSEQTHPDADPSEAFCELRAIMTRLSPRDAELAATARAMFEWHRSHQFCAKCGAKSDMVHAGWQRSCTVCDAQHFPRTDPVAIMLITHGNKTLLGRSPGWPERMYSTLAGFIEPGETPEAAVRREVWEEAGVKVGKVKYLGSQPWAFPSSLMMAFHGEALSEDITIDPEEIEDALWITREDLMLAAAGDHPEISPARKGSIANFILTNWLADSLD